MRISDWSSDVCSSDLHLPLVRLAQAQRIGGQEDRRGNPPGPVLGEGVHRLQLAAAQAVEKLELADQLVRRVRLERELAGVLLDDAVTPGLDGFEVVDIGRASSRERAVSKFRLLWSHLL